MVEESTLEYSALEDVELVEEIKNGKQEAFNVLLDRYSNRISYIAGRFFCSGLTQHDYFQEGAIGLFIAVRKYQADRGASFGTFAELQIRSNIINAVKRATRKKNSFLNNSFSLDCASNQNENGPAFIKFLRHTEPSPEEILLRKFDRYEIRRKLMSAQLTVLERNVLIKLCSGSSYKEAADALGVATKSIDNAYRRAKKKFANA